MECGLIGDSELVRSHGQAAPLLEPVDASLDCVALSIRLGVESRWMTAGAASPQAVADLVGGLEDDSADSASVEVISNRAEWIRAVREHGIGPGPWSSGAASRNTYAGHDGLEDRRVARLACGDAECQGSCMTVTGEVDLRAQAAAGASERVVVRFGADWRPFFWLRRRAGELGRRWSPPTRSSRCHQHPRPPPEPWQGCVPRCRPWPT